MLKQHILVLRRCDILFYVQGSCHASWGIYIITKKSDARKHFEIPKVGQNVEDRLQTLEWMRAEEHSCK